MTMSESNVNPRGNVSSEINVKRIGAQQKEILRFLYDHSDKVWEQVEIIEELYGDVTDSRKASVSRSISRLRDQGLAYRRQKVLITPDDNPLANEPYYSRHRPRFALTDAGMEFLEDDARFPGIGGDDDE